MSRSCTAETSRLIPNVALKQLRTNILAASKRGPWSTVADGFYSLKLLQKKESYIMCSKLVSVSTLAIGKWFQMLHSDIPRGKDL